MPLVGIVALPLLIVATPLFVFLLRCRENARPGDLPASASPQTSSALHELEDHDITNQYTAIGAVKPGRLPPLAADRRCCC